MESNGNIQEDSEAAAVKKRAATNYLLLSVLEIALGTGLLACGGVAVNYTSGKDYHARGPPYYLGAFIVGVLLIGCGLTGAVIFLRVRRSFHISVRTERNSLITYMLCNAILSGIMSVAALVGAFVCVLYGIYLCERGLHPTMCSYTKNHDKNLLMAVIIDTALLAVIPLCIHSICVLKRFGKPLTKYRTPNSTTNQAVPLVDIAASSRADDNSNNPGGSRVFAAGTTHARRHSGVKDTSAKSKQYASSTVGNRPENSNTFSTDRLRDGITVSLNGAWHQPGCSDAGQGRATGPSLVSLDSGTLSRTAQRTSIGTRSPSETAEHNLQAMQDYSEEPPPSYESCMKEQNRIP